MEANFNDYTIDTYDIWSFEAHHFLMGNRTDEQTYHLKSVLEKQIIKKREEQQKHKKRVTIMPFVTDADRDNNTNKAYWLRHVKEFKNAGSLIDQVKLNYFCFFDKRLESFFSLEQKIIITRENDTFDFWFALKLGQYKDGLKYLNDFLNHHLQETFESEIEHYKSFLHILLKQYKNEFLNEDIIELTNEWLSMNFLKTIDPENISQKIKLAGQISTFYLKKVEDKPLFLDNGDGLIGIQEILFLLKKEKFIKENTEIKAFSKIFKGKALDENEKIVWVGIKVELKWFVELIIHKNICVQINEIDKWLIAQKCFLYQKKDGTIEAINNYLSISEARGDKMHRKEILNKILEKLNKIGNATPT